MSNCMLHSCDEVFGWINGVCFFEVGSCAVSQFKFLSELIAVEPMKCAGVCR